MGRVIPQLPRDAPARPRASDLLSADHPLRPFPPLHRRRFAVWFRALVFMAVLAGTGVVLGFGLTFAVLLSNSGSSLWVFPVTELAATVVAFVVLLRVEARHPVELAPQRIGGLAGGLALGAVLMSAVIAVLFVLGSYRIIGTDPDYQVWLDLLSAGITAAIAEEIVFRAVLFRLLEELVGTWGAIAASAAVFGLAHLSNPNASLWGAIAIALEAGVLFAALYALTRSLWWTIGLHFSWNMLQGPVFGSAVSGSGVGRGWLQAQFSGPDWLTGGAFGVEASVVSVALLTLVAAALLHVIFHQELAVKPSWVRHRYLRDSASVAAASD